jgi:hypothetical protein
MNPVQSTLEEWRIPTINPATITQTTRNQNNLSESDNVIRQYEQSTTLASSSKYLQHSNSSSASKHHRLTNSKQTPTFIQQSINPNVTITKNDIWGHCLPKKSTEY